MLPSYTTKLTLAITAIISGCKCVSTLYTAATLHKFFHEKIILKSLPFSGKMLSACLTFAVVSLHCTK